MQVSYLNDDRFFSPEPDVRKIARELYDGIKSNPIISPHGHVDPNIFVDNKPFPNPKELFISPDHYVFRMLYSQGIKLEELDIPDKDGNTLGLDPKKVWKIFGEKFYLFAGTPSGAWLDYEFSEVFGIKEKLNGENSEKIFDEINEKLQSPEFLPRSLYERFNIEVLSTTDAAADSLDAHKKIKESGWKGKVIPAFRPDSVTDLSNAGWKSNIDKLAEAAGMEINSYNDFIKSIENRREFFKSMGATSTDHGVLSPYTNRLLETDAEKIFQRALQGKTEEKDSFLFTAHMLMELARMSMEDGLVMQIHPGSHRNHNKVIFDKYGPDKGCDIPQQTEYTNNLKALLNEYGNNPKLSVILFTLDESNYSRELAPLAGHYPALKLGPSWWFHDSIQGMTRFREMVTETAGFYNTVGFNDDTRAFVSIPARHDLSRRVDSNFLAGLVAKYIIDISDAKKLSQELSYNLVKSAYKL